MCMIDPLQNPLYSLSPWTNDQWGSPCLPADHEPPQRIWPRPLSPHDAVPIIPPRPPFNPVVAKCGACGLELRRVMMYCCQRSDCPCFPRVTC